MAAAGEVWDRAHRGLTIGLLSTVAFTAFEALAVATVLPTTVDEIGGLALYGWAFSAFMLSSLIGITAGGSLADRRGPALPFLAGAAVFVGGLIGAGASPTMPLLVAARFVQGLGSGAIGSVSYVAVGRGYSPEARPRMIALLSSAWVIPGLVGPALAGLVTDVFGWRWVFFGLAPATAVGAAIAAPAMQRLARGADTTAEPVATGEHRTRDAFLLTLGAGLLMGGLEGSNGAAAAALALGGLLLGVPAARRLLPPGTLLARTDLGAAVALIGLTGFAFFGAEAFLPLAISGVRDQPATIAGLPLTIGTLTWTAGAWIQARETDRRSRRSLVVLGFLLIGAGVAGTSAILVPSIPLWAAGLAWGVTALGMGITYSTLALVILECAREGEEGRASAALQLSYTLCIALGTGVGGGIVALATRLGRDLSTGIALVNVVMVVVVLVAILGTGRIPKTREEAQQVAS
ncbi:MAG: MFS transporter [Candidatus Binatia bacterium]|nr:MFS transporter [Candidatus Binatia bacterium]